MITTIKIRLVLILVSFLAFTASYAQLTHPGGWLNSTDLSRIREKVASGEEPWASAWDAVKDDGADEGYRANVSSTITSDGTFQSQGQAAFVLAVKWIVTGDKDYATAGINIIDAWADTVTNFDIKNDPLRQGIGANIMANAAEILAWGFNGEAGWSLANIEKAQNWFINIVYPYTSTGGSRSMNWGTSCLAGNMSMAIFCDNTSMFDDAVDAYKFGFTNTTDGCAGVTQYIINEEGQCFESQRDQGHTQGGIAHLVEPAMIAWNQGVDLVSYSDYRLVAGMEYTAKYNLNNDVSWTNDIPNPCNLSFNWMNNGYISEDGRGVFSPVYVMANTLFEYADIEHPYTDEVASSPDYFPEYTNSDHPGMGHLLYSGATSEVIDTTEFVPDPNKVYYIDATHHNVRLAATGESEEAYTTDITEKGTNVEWKFVDKGNGYWHIQRAAGGTKPRLRTDVSENADMQEISSSGTYTYYEITTGDITGSYFLTLPNGPSTYNRLQINSSLDVKMVSSTEHAGTWESFIITEVETTATETFLEAEDYDNMLGIQTEASSESGDNVGWINDGDWLRFDEVNLSGISNMDARVATKNVGGTIEVRTGSATGTLIGSISISNTGGNQNWTTLNTSMSSTNGTQDVYLVFTGGNGYLFNLNWVEFNTSSRSAKNASDGKIVSEILMYPNPVTSSTNIKNAANSTIIIYDINGLVVLTKSILSDNEVVGLSGLSTGVYYVKINNKKTQTVTKFIKQ